MVDEGGPVGRLFVAIFNSNAAGNQELSAMYVFNLQHRALRIACKLEETL